MSKVDQISLSSTLSGRGGLPDGLAHFRAFLRAERDDTADDDDTVKGDAERDLDFVVATTDVAKMSVADLKAIGKRFFTGSSKLPLSNATRRADLERRLTRAGGLDSEADVKAAKADLEAARTDVWTRVQTNHDAWVKKLRDDKVITDRSGETFFNGWQN